MQRMHPAARAVLNPLIVAQARTYRLSTQDIASTYCARMVARQPRTRYHMFPLETASDAAERMPGRGPWVRIPSSTTASQTLMPPPASDYTVAVVDDDENVLKSLDILLQSADYSVRLFAS